jgi:hypothetical protein
VSASAVVEILAPGHHNAACLGFRGEVLSGQDLAFEGRKGRLRGGVIEPALPIDCETPSFRHSAVKIVVV